MIFGISALLILTVLLIIDIGLLMFRFWYMESKQESIRLKYQEEMRAKEANSAFAAKMIREGRINIIDSMERAQQLVREMMEAKGDEPT